MDEIESFLEAYWIKYPKEKQNDISLSHIPYLLDKGIQYYLRNNVFILYMEHSTCVDILCYWCDGENISRKDLVQGLRDHKAFVSSFNKPVYSEDMKDLFKRHNLGRQENNKWRWI